MRFPLSAVVQIREDDAGRYVATAPFTDFEATAHTRDAAWGLFRDQMTQRLRESQDERDALARYMQEHPELAQATSALPGAQGWPADRPRSTSD